MEIERREPNEVTKRALRDAHEDKNLFTCDTVEELFEELEKEDDSTE